MLLTVLESPKKFEIELFRSFFIFAFKKKIVLALFRIVDKFMFYIKASMTVLAVLKQKVCSFFF
jgi:hypothetical protein